MPSQSSLNQAYALHTGKENSPNTWTLEPSKQIVAKRWHETLTESSGRIKWGREWDKSLDRGDTNSDRDFLCDTDGVTWSRSYEYNHRWRY